MGGFSNWSFNSKVTFWAPVLDAYGQESSWTRSVFSCEYKSGGQLILSNTAAQFFPNTIVYLEASDANAPQKGWKMKLGEHTDASPPDDAETVRSVRSNDPSTFNEGLPDYEVATG